MAPQDTAHRKETPKPEKKEEEKLLDKSLEDSFPASDPSSVTRAPKEKRETKLPPEGGADRRTPATPTSGPKPSGGSSLEDETVKRNRTREID